MLFGVFPTLTRKLPIYTVMILRRVDLCSLLRCRLVCRVLNNFIDSKTAALLHQLPPDYEEWVKKGRVRLIDVLPRLYPSYGPQRQILSEGWGGAGIREAVISDKIIATRCDDQTVHFYSAPLGCHLNGRAFPDGERLLRLWPFSNNKFLLCTRTKPSFLSLRVGHLYLASPWKKLKRIHSWTYVEGKLPLSSPCNGSIAYWHGLLKRVEVIRCQGTGNVKAFKVPGKPSKLLLSPNYLAVVTQKVSSPREEYRFTQFCRKSGNALVQHLSPSPKNVHYGGKDRFALSLYSRRTLVAISGTTFQAFKCNRQLILQGWIGGALVLAEGSKRFLFDPTLGKVIQTFPYNIHKKVPHSYDSGERPVTDGFFLTGWARGHDEPLWLVSPWAQQLIQKGPMLVCKQDCVTSVTMTSRYLVFTTNSGQLFLWKRP